MLPALTPVESKLAALFTDVKMGEPAGSSQRGTETSWWTAGETTGPDMTGGAGGLTALAATMGKRPAMRVVAPSKANHLRRAGEAIKAKPSRAPYPNEAGKPYRIGNSFSGLTLPTNRVAEGFTFNPCP